jgi:cyanophycinase-like exopeptidase
MSSNKGVIALMGSGELTATMVEVHKELLAGPGESPRAVFLDTPAGFQLNVDQLSERAVEYFRIHVQQKMSVASFKSNETSTPYEAEQAFHSLRHADFVLIGPGSPSYAVRQWRETPIPEILATRLEQGACLVAASAAALTVGRFTLPVYEIYKVGEEPHWVEGMDVLGRFGFNLVVVPHWNNAEGGTHDTRFCYMGEPRFRRLESLLPGDSSVLGLDEHTACLIDLEREEAVIKGIGSVTLRRNGAERKFERGDRFSVEVLRGGDVGKGWKAAVPEMVDSEPSKDKTKEASFWHEIHGNEAAFRQGLESDDPGEATNALLELDRTIWKAQQDLESQDFISQAREILRELIVSLGIRLESSPGDRVDCLAPLVEELLALRERFRQNKQWQEADAIRESLQRACIIVDDTQDGPRWHLKG